MAKYHRKVKSQDRRYLVMAAAIILAVCVGFMIGRFSVVAPKHKGRAVSAGKKQVLPAPAARVKPTGLPQVAKNAARPRVAIVMDDFGYSTGDMEAFFGIGEPITLSILPNQPYSSKIANRAHSKGYECILHLPLEPKRTDVQEEPDTIRSSMNDEEIRSRLKDEIESVPHIKGVSNHMGSRGTEDERVMSVIMEELKKRRMFFFDSLTSDKSICRETARRSGVRYARRDIFLDIPNDPAYIEKKIMEMRKMAFSEGSAIAVGHYRRNTIAALKKYLPAMAAEGIKFVYISEFEK
jgi:polysaccharide deacetylase 2 family uncharacterized protein YibQ